MRTLAAAVLRLRIAAQPAVLEAIALAVYLGSLAVVIRKFAAVRPLWYDELFTLHLSRIGSPLELFKHLAAGVDLNPPLLYLLTHLSISLFGESCWAVRLPALVGLVAGLLCLFAFLRRRVSAPTALLALTASVASVKVWVYFLEARPYGLAFGFAGLALLSWQRRWLVVLALASFFGVSTHYYFVTVLAALGVAEIARLARQNQFEIKPLLMLACGGVALLAWYPLWSVAPREYAAGFWAKATFSRASVQETYTHFVEPSLVIPALIAIIAAFVLAKRDPSETLEPHETAAIAVLALTPVLGVLLGATLTGGFYFRYVLPATLAFGSLFALAMSRLAGGNRLPLLLGAFAFAFLGIPCEQKRFREFFQHESETVVQQATALNQYAGGQRVVIETGFEFGRLWHYSNRSFQPLFLADAELALKHTKTDTTERALMKLTAVTDVPAVLVADVIADLQAGWPVFYFGPGTAWGFKELTARGIQFEKVAAWPINTLWRLKLN